MRRLFIVACVLLSQAVQLGCVQRYGGYSERADISRVVAYMADGILEPWEHPAGQRATEAVTEEEERRIRQETFQREESVRMTHLLKMTPKERDLVVRTWAALYWDVKLRSHCGNIRGRTIIFELLEAATDRSYDELLRIARYSNDVEDVYTAMHRLRWPRRSIEMWPTFLEIAERKELPEDIRGEARAAAAFSLIPLSVWDLAEQLEKSGLFDSASDRAKRNRLYDEIERKIVDFNLKLPGLVGRDAWCEGFVLLLRQSRGMTPLTLVVQPFQEARHDERMVVEALARRLQVLRMQRDGEGSRKTHK